VLRLRRLEMENNMIIHVVHVSGKRMIDQGTDSLSRADHLEGVMQGRSMIEPKLKSWVDLITKGFNVMFLEPEDWFDKGNGYGTYILMPTSVAAEVVDEQLE
jgi:hypothetical protein